jgi:glycine/D-amino acid oxidase-like deaminating enzyme
MRARSVAVLGAGIVGAAVARAAAAGGAEVFLIDAAVPGSGTSGTSLAWLNSNRKLPRGYHDFSVRAMGEWRRLAADLGWPGWYVPTGNLVWAVDDGQREDLAATVARLRDWGYPVTEPDARAVAGLEPRLRVPAAAAVAFFPDEAFIHPAEAVAALVAQARALGARLFAGGGPSTFDVDGSRVAGIRLPDGQRIRADAYVCCAGAGTPSVMQPLGVRVPLVPADAPGSAAPGLVACVRTDTPLLSRVVHAPDLSIRPATPTGLRMDAEDVNGRVDTTTDRTDLDRQARTLYERARRVLTGVPGETAVEARLCIRPLPVDGRPITGWLPTHDNVYLVVGHSGATLAALLADLTAEEILTRRTRPDLDPYRLDRFPDI